MAELNGMQGNEIADDFKRKANVQGRWKASWELVRGNFWKLVALNLITLVFFVPGIVVVYFRNVYILSLSETYPFNATVGSYPPSVLIGLAERVNLSADILFYALLIVAGFIASLGVAGSTYCIRKLIQTRGEFHFKSFFHGIKVSYFNTVFPATMFILFIYCTYLVRDWMRIECATGGNKAGAITAYVFMVIADVLAGIYLAWVFAIGVGYRVKFKYLLRNAFVLIAGTPIQTIFMAGFSLIPVWFLFAGGFWLIFAYIIMAFFGFSFILLCWLSFTQWAFDLYITPAVQAEKETERAKKSDKELAEEKAADDRQRALELLAAGRSELISHPIKPINREEMIPSLGKTFTRAQVAGAAETREKLAADIAAYEKEHEKDAVFVEYNKMFAEREKALNVPDQKGKKKKKISSDNLLK